VKKELSTICNDTGKTKFGFGRFEGGKQYDVQGLFFLTSSLGN
jgi:hypothetical protein